MFNALFWQGKIKNVAKKEHFLHLKKAPTAFRLTPF
jgi:hypothetical protein